MKIREICNILNGFAFKSSKYVEEGYRVIRITNVQSGYIEDENPVFYEYDEKLEKYELKKDDILISLTGNVGRCALMENVYLPAYLNQRVCCLRVNSSKVDSRFLFYLLNTKKFEFDCINSAQGIAQLNMSTEWLKEYDLNIPSLEIQKSIVKKLDLVFNCISRKKSQLESYNNLVKSQFVEMFGDMKENPFNFPIKELSQLCKKITDGEHSTPIRSNEGIYLLSARNVLNHKLNIDDVDFIDDKEYNRISKRIIPEAGDVLLSCSGSVGRVCSIPKNFKCQLVRSVAILKLNKFVNNIFMEYAIDSDYMQNQINRKINQSSQANLFQGQIAKLNIILPPIELQIRFATIVELIDKQKFVNLKLCQIIGEISIL